MTTNRPLTDSSSLSDMLTVISDRRALVDQVASFLRSHWSYDLTSRQPPVVDEESGDARWNDLACFLTALAERRAIINLPVYKSRRPQQKRSNEHVISAENRHGKILRVVSNKDLFSFGVLVEDLNVIKSDGERDSAGALRNFLVMDLDGTWYDGWKAIEFLPNTKENDWLTSGGWTGNRVMFDAFVHPNRWTAFYGKYYLATKVLVERLEEEAKALRAWLKEHAKEATSSSRPRDGTVTESGPSRSVTVAAFEATIEHPLFTGKFAVPRSIKMARERLSAANDALYPLRFAVRTTELAFYENAIHRGQSEPLLPSWVKDGPFRWIGYRKPRSAVQWQSLQMANMPSVAIRYRIWEKTERVAA